MTQATQAQLLQRSATNPNACIWVNASAGTGKTKVLTDRILSLLLQGTKPERILCLTFTRAAAAEMVERLNTRLSQWAVLDDETLAQELEALTGQAPHASLLSTARTLFSDVLDAPGGMKIQTIHSFCQTLLHRFPLEAGISPSSTLIDEPTANELLHEAEASVLGNKDVEPQVKEALTCLTRHFEYNTFHSLIRDLLSKRYKLAWLYNESDPFKAINSYLEKALECSLEESEDQLIADFCDIDETVAKDLEEVAHHLCNGSVTDQNKGQLIQAWLKSASRKEEIENYKGAFLTEKGTILKTLATKTCCEENPHILSILQTEAERILEYVERCNSHHILNISHALIIIGWAIFRAYQDIKYSRNLLDYDDLIAFSLKLLSQPDIAPWILFKLDGGLDHILIDEAQDTNIQQWKVIETLLQEFFSGIGAQDSPRTLFVVGDAKQSIYSFQGADPRLFEHMRRHYSQAIKESQLPWHDLELALSFRSTSAVLEAVDAVFNDERARQGVVLPSSSLQHHAYRQGHGGSVEVWPLIVSEERESSLPWDLPTRIVKHTPAPHERLADHIAERIHTWLSEGTMLESRNRPIRPSDILILVRRRSGFVDALMRALKCRNIPVAGVDRLALTDHLAVMDLIALGNFLLLPDDDLNLAAVLKSPFINLSEEQLFDLCYQRGDETVWRQLKQKASSHVDYEQAYTYLATLLARTDYLSPFELFSHILGPLGGRKALLSRLGPEANDPIDEFLNLTLTYQNLHTPTLQGFLHWLKESNPEIKRETAGSNRDEVRIMTVHGSKGLQAPIVFLPDTLHTRYRKDLFLWDHNEHSENNLPLWSPSEKGDCAYTRLLKQYELQKTTHESNRLLYVALTRAEDHLYVCGWSSSTAVKEDSWYAHIQRALAPIASSHTYDFTTESKWGWCGAGLRLTCPQDIEIPASSNASTDFIEPLSAAPSWLHTPAPQEATTSLFINPSKITSEDSSARSPLTAKGAARYQRGVLIHSLLQYLPAIPARQQVTASQLYLNQCTPEMPLEAQDTIIKAALNILNHSDFSHFFDPSSKAEVPVIGTVDGQLISGQVDQLVITDNEVLILDFKSNQRIPENPQSVPLTYKRQMACYKSLLKGLYPSHTVRCFLLWTEGPILMELFEESLEV